MSGFDVFVFDFKESKIRKYRFFCNEEFYHIRQNFLVLSHLRKKFYLEYDFYFSWAKKNLVGNGREKREERKGILVY